MMRTLLLLLKCTQYFEKACRVREGTPHTQSAFHNLLFALCYCFAGQVIACCMLCIPHPALLNNIDLSITFITWALAHHDLLHTLMWDSPVRVVCSAASKGASALSLIWIWERSNDVLDKGTLGPIVITVLFDIGGPLAFSLVTHALYDPSTPWAFPIKSLLTSLTLIGLAWRNAPSWCIMLVGAASTAPLVSLGAQRIRDFLPPRAPQDKPATIPSKAAPAKTTKDK